MDTTLSVLDSPVCLKRDTGGGGFGDDCNILLAPHETVLLRDVQGLEGNVLLGTGFVTDFTVFILDDATFTSWKNKTTPIEIVSVKFLSY